MSFTASIQFPASRFRLLTPNFWLLSATFLRLQAGFFAANLVDNRHAEALEAEPEDAREGERAIGGGNLLAEFGKVRGVAVAHAPEAEEEYGGEAQVKNDGEGADQFALVVFGCGGIAHTGRQQNPAAAGCQAGMGGWGRKTLVSQFDFAHWSFALKGRRIPAQGFSRQAGDTLGYKFK